MTAQSSKYIPCLIHQNAIKRPYQIATKTATKNYTYEELNLKIELFQTNLKRYNLKNQLVALALHSDLNEIALYFALLRMQAIPFLIDKHLPSENVNTLITSNNIAYLFSNHAFDIDSTVQISNFENTLNEYQIIIQRTTFYTQNKLHLFYAALVQQEYQNNVVIY